MNISYNLQTCEIPGAGVVIQGRGSGKWGMVMNSNFSHTRPLPNYWIIFSEHIQRISFHSPNCHVNLAVYYTIHQL
jgi:hypothetical protein